MVSQITKPTVLIGFMGAGKSTVARALAAALGVEAVDSDEVIEKQVGVPIDEFFATQGERAFRRLEAETIPPLIKKDCVLSLGGGAVTVADVRDRLQEANVIYLETEPEQAWRRVKNSSRPLARDREAFFSLHEKRRPLYEKLADVFLRPTSPRTVRKAAAEVALVGGTENTKLVWATNKSKDYPVFFGDGALDALDSVVAGRRIFVICDTNTERICNERVTTKIGAGQFLGAYAVSAGETSKNLETVKSALSAMAENKVNRSDLVLAVGGGVVGDLAGFCAAIYQRGVDYVQVPTSLVAQVDSAFGGKTGVDLPVAKNYVGAFYQPSAVFCVPQLLGSLPPAEYDAGYAEVIKTALLAGGDLWRSVCEGGVDESIILGCIRTKLRVVSGDERDQGIRASLNLGHTAAHAIEAATEYRQYRHGEAVAVGLLVALALSEQVVGLDLTVRARVHELLQSRGLPTTVKGVTVDALVEKMRLDKKIDGGKVQWALLQEPGTPLTGQELKDELVVANLEGFIE